MRRCVWLVVLVVGCSEKKKEAPAPAPAPAAPAAKPEAPPAAKPEAPPAPAPAKANPNAVNTSDLKITGTWEATLIGGGAYCRFNNDAKEREIDRGARIKVDTKKLGLEGRFVSFSISTNKDGKVQLIQVDVTTDEPVGAGGGNAKKMLTYTMHSPGAKITKAEVAPDGTSATVDATLGSTKKDGKTVTVAGTITCKHIGTFAF